MTEPDRPNVPRQSTARVSLQGAATLALLMTAACAKTAAPPSPADPVQSVPDLRGQRVMLFPVQALQGIGESVDAELAFALAQRGGGVDWVLPAQMTRATASSPGLDARLTGLPVGMFMQAEVSRVGDPLFGYLRRMGALMSSDVALIPVMARYRPESPGGAGVANAPPTPSGIEIAATLIAIRSGQVLWFGLVEGAPGAANDTRALATAADALSRRLLPFPAR